MSRIFFIIVPFFVGLFSISCEELIDVNLNEGDPRYVIEADITTLSDQQIIKVSETVAFSSQQPNKPITGADVTVSDSKGRIVKFADAGQGSYIASNFRPEQNRTYNLSVRVGDNVYESSTQLQDFVAIDSIGIIEETVFNDKYYFVILKFTDLPNIANYYRYTTSVNEGAFKFSTVFDDKFNDGLFVSHQITNSENTLAIGDSITIRRQCITKPVYDYWNEIQFANPGNASPSNPTSNISNGAFGYFSVSATKEYGMRIMSLE